jgi:tetratricopeptide (TPR) repeat protein
VADIWPRFLKFHVLSPKVVPNMATPDNGNEIQWKKRETLGSAMVQIIIVGVVLALTVFFVYRRGSTKRDLADLMTQARQTTVRGNLADVKKAIGLAEEALALDSSATDPNAFLAAQYTDLWLVHRENGAEAKAKEFLEKAKSVNAQTEDRYGAEAQHLLAAGKAKEAETFVEDLRKKGGSGARIFYAQGMALRAQGNLKLASTSLKAAMDKAWKDLNYADAWGDALLEDGTPGAIDAFSKASGQNSEHVRSRLGLALARVQKRDRVGDAAAILKELQADDAKMSAPQKARALAITAAIFNIESQHDQAIVMADQALALNPDDAWALQAKANALALKKDPAAAAAYDAVVAKAPHAPVFYFEGAKNMAAAGLNDQAMALLSKYEGFFKAVKNTTIDGKEEIYLDRDDRYWLARGELLKALNKPDEAMAAYDKAIEAKSVNLSRAYYAKASLLLEKKDFEKAGELLVDITPPDGSGRIAEAYMAMGEIMMQKKDWQGALQNYAYALARMKAAQEPREKLNEVLTDVEKKLKAANQREVAKVWIDEAKPLIQ